MKLADDLTCADLVELVTEYQEGALSPPDRQRFEEHVVFCEGCASFLDQMRSTLTVLGRITEEDFAPETMDELLRAFQEWRRE